MTTAVSVDAVERASQAEAPQTGVAGPDTESRAWIADLEDSGQRHDEAVARLHQLLLGAARFEVNRRRATLPHLRGDDFDDLAMQSADDALVAVLSKLDTTEATASSPPGPTSSPCSRRPSSCAGGRGRDARCPSRRRPGRSSRPTSLARSRAPRAASSSKSFRRRSRTS